MKLVFSGNDFKYELEGIMKLFIPAQLFTHVFEEKPDNLVGDYAFMRRKRSDKHTLLYVICSYNGRQAHKSAVLDNNADNYENECELSLSRLLYSCMQKITGKQAKWGIITGIRPVKRINYLLDMGLNRDEVYSYMMNKYLCSKEKCDIAYNTSLTQNEILKNLDDKSFSLYVSIPFCPTRCSYCSFVSQSVEGCMKLIPDYVDHLCDEIKHTADIVKKLGLVLDTVYFGGGTPSTLSAEQLDVLMKTIAESFDMSHLREYTVEAGRADTITREKLEAIKKNGCDRISINPQTLNDNVLNAIGRKHTVAQFYESYALAKEVGFKNINTDIIAGLPEDTVESFKFTVDKLIEMNPENITVHTLSIKRAARLNHTDNDEVLESPASRMVDYATQKLTEAGYNPYYLYRQKNMLENQENIGWAKKGSESLYNIYIMDEVQTIIAVGAGGSTKLVDMKNHRLDRVFNYKFPLEYIRHFDLMLEKKHGVEEFYAEEK